MAFYAGIKSSIVIGEDFLSCIDFPAKLISTLDICAIQDSTSCEIMNIKVCEIV